MKDKDSDSHQRVTKRGASTSGTGVPCEVSAFGVSGRDVQPTLEPARPSCRAVSSGRFLEQRARVGPRPWSRIRKQLRARGFVLTAWSSCRGPRRSAASESAVVPSTTPGSPSSNAWPARPRLLRHATSWLQPHSAHLIACRAAQPFAPILRYLASIGPVAPSSRSKLALNSRSVPTYSQISTLCGGRLPHRIACQIESSIESRLSGPVR